MNTRARCWGYNGSTPGPTIEAVEGDRVRIYVTNRLPEHTSIHWHGILLPSGMDGVGGLSQAVSKNATASMMIFIFPPGSRLEHNYFWQRPQ